MSNLANRAFAEQAKPRWLVLLTIVTAVYLLVECGFNSRLLDVIGAMPDDKSVEAIEVFGRSISGFAAALVLWPAVFSYCARGDRGPIKTAWILAVVSACVITVVYRAEKHLVDAIVDRSTPDTRYVATNLALVQQALVAQHATLDGLPMTAAQMTEPDGKTFLAIFPLLAFSTKDVNDKIRDYKPEILRQMIERQYGGRAGSYNNFIHSRAALIQLYNEQYLSGCRKYDEAMARIPDEQARAWESYRERVRRKGLSPERVPPFYWGRVRDDVRKSGVYVPNNWRPDDRAGFDRAVANRVRGEAEQRFREAIAKQSPEVSVPPNLGKDAFFANPSVQHYWRKQLGYPEPGPILPASLPVAHDAPEFFFKAVYEKVIALRLAEGLKEFDAAPKDYADHAKYEARGRSSMRALVVPPIALSFSILGALVHTVKLALFLLQLCTGKAFTNGAVKMAAVMATALCLLGACYFIPTSSIPRQPLYQYFEARGDTLGGDGEANWRGKLAMFFAHSTINAQKIAYPIFEAVRIHVLRGYEFGYHPEQPASHIAT